VSVRAAWVELRRTKLMLRASTEFAVEEIGPLAADIYTRRFGDNRDEFLKAMAMMWDVYHENKALMQ
jgi:hypothetical protein